MSRSNCINATASVVFLFIGAYALHGQNSMGIGTTTPNPNAVLELVSPTNNQGLLVPRLTSAARTSMSLSVAENGLMVYDLDENQFYFWVNTVWVSVSNTSGDMVQSVYDTNADGVVDNSEVAQTVNGFTVDTTVPAGALFTDAQTAVAVPYDGTTSGLTAADVQAAIDEIVSSSTSGDMLQSTYDSNGDGIVDNAAAVSGFTVGTPVPGGAVFTDAQNAIDVPYDATTSGLAATDVQGAIDELDIAIDADAGGDMLQSTYDTDIDGVVDVSEAADSLSMNFIDGITLAYNSGVIEVNDNSISSAKIQNSSITSAKLSFLGSEGQPLVYSLGAWQAGNTDWLYLANVPAGLSDGDDVGITDLTSFTTDELTEGSTNLYYTDAAVTSLLSTTSVNALSDVTVTTPSSGEYLRYDGSTWLNTGIDLADLSGENLQIINATGGNTLVVTNNGTTGNAGIFENTVGGNGSPVMSVTGSGSGDGILLTQDADAIGLNAFNNDATGTLPVASINQYGLGRGLEVYTDLTTNNEAALDIYQSGSGRGLMVEKLTSGLPAIQANYPGTGAAMILNSLDGSNAVLIEFQDQNVGQAAIYDNGRASFSGVTFGNSADDISGNVRFTGTTFQGNLDGSPGGWIDFGMLTSLQDAYDNGTGGITTGTNPFTVGGTNAITLAAGGTNDLTLQSTSGNVSISGANFSVGTGGNLTLAGTVDGRDVATDGTNLDAVVSAVGAGVGNADLGTGFSGVITDNSNVKTALIALESSLQTTNGLIREVGSVGNRTLIGGSGAAPSYATGFRNLILGDSAAITVTDAAYNTYVGFASAGASLASGQGFNTFLGYESGRFNAADYNTFLGAGSGRDNSTAAGNTFVGYHAGSANTTHSGNTFIGYQSGEFTGGSNPINNTFLGYQAGQYNNGANNIFVGRMAGKGDLGSEITGNANVFIGSSSGINTTTGSTNVFVGNSTGFSHTTGNGNTYLGNAAGSGNTTGGSNVFIGSGAGQTADGVSQNVIIGSSAGTNLGQNGNVLIGFDAETTNGTIVNSVAIGNQSVVGLSNGIVLGRAGTSAPNVGIGTTTPGAHLHIRAGFATTNPEFIIENPNGNTSADATLNFRNNNGANQNFAMGIDADSQDFLISQNFSLGINDRLVIESGTGNVGIGTNTPSQRLDVNGNIAIPNANEYRYTTAKTRVISIASTAFVGDSLSPARSSPNSGLYRYVGGAPTGNLGIIYAPVHLPDGARVQTLEATVYDNDADDLTVQLVAINLSTSPGGAVVGGVGASTTGLSAAYQVINSDLLNQLINNSVNAYHIEFRSSRNTPDLRIVGVKITYTVDYAD